MNRPNLVIPFADKPELTSLPTTFTYPFCYQPDPWAKQAATELQQWLSLHAAPPEQSEGKMYGVLVVKNHSGELGYLCAYSGASIAEHPKEELYKQHFVPNIFNGFSQDSDFVKHQTIINNLNNEIDTLTTCSKLTNLTQQLTTLKQQAENAIRAEQQKMVEAKKQRKLTRESIAEQLSPWSEQHTPVQFKEAKHVSISLARESVENKKALQTLKTYWQQKITTLSEQVTEKLAIISTLKKRRKKLSNKLQRQLFQQYLLLNIKGEKKGILELFAENDHAKPPAGTGDCAAPKLLQYAFQHQLIPICFTEFWWGKSHPAEIRKHSHFYPACQGKCGPILPFMLQGLAVDTNPLLSNPAEKLALDIVYHDQHLVVVNKPAGLLSVPGKNIQDSVETRIKAQFPQATGKLIVHRLDMATSGLLVLALTERAHKSIQQQFIEKTIEKRYIALVDGIITEESGNIDLPLILDINDRPRQKVCHEHGKVAKTTWQVLEHIEGKTIVQLYPITGRTHQLRVHCAHPDGLNTPITGDGLYGTSANRLHLHAEALRFNHPITKQRLSFVQKVTF
ncbi:pseudouridine synthase [Thalassotalea sp. 1_MG-2023]|uniref:RluA family pseudouridine synthase n=1 Tax=Thalassotalea sp. 1_MG-2023 TaxID=3062680 RepID=UPI0026E42B86|nr:RluA family pseudouridine synthase [Thalassotalea sp. 1_MG-2023]MDO6426129.1 pseudouridine synthase [Thalassotalea sp. 1_MG-2023]